MFIIISENAFSGLSIMIVVDLPRLPSVRGIFNFSRLSNKDCPKHFVGLQFKHLFNFSESTEIAHVCRE